MLSKLISYEFKATRRLFLPAYGVVLILSILNGIFVALPSSTLDNISAPFGVIMTVYILAMFAVCVLTFAYMINRFYKNLLGDEGYLMFTLPARPSELIWAKCITSSLWMLFTAIVCTASLFLLMMPAIVTTNNLIIDGNVVSLWSQILRIIGDIWNYYHVHTITLPLLIVVLGVIWVANFCMHIYACLAIGSLANKHRLGCAFLAYLGFGVLMEILLIIVASLPNFPFHISIPDGLPGTYLGIAVVIAYYFVNLLVNFVITNYILSRRLNLQ